MLLRLIGEPFYFAAVLVGLLLAITLHEYAHAFISTKLGDPTAKTAGRLSLNPFAHLDPIGTLFLLFAGFGWGKPVPYDPRYLKNRSDEFKIAIAGPITNILLAFVLAIPYKINLIFPNIIPLNLITFVDIIVELNLYLAIFNLLPIPPLDGSKIFLIFLNDEQKQTFYRVGPFFIVGLFALIYFFGNQLFASIIFPLISWLSYVVKVFPIDFFIH